MKYEDFVRCVQTKVKEKMGNEVQIDLHRVTKNNGVEMDGLSIREEAQKISPMLYLADYYQLYEEGSTFPEIVEEILKIYEKSKVNAPIDAEFYHDFERIKTRLACKMINYEKNKLLLQEIPYISYLDLAVVFYYSLENEEIGSGTILIYDSHLSMWKISKEQLYEIARRNTPKLFPYEFKAMGELIAEAFEDSVSPEDEEQALPMYVLTNSERHLGAVNILYDSILSSIGERIQDSFFILPSSVHECIIVPAEVRASKTDLESMVCEINRTQVLPEEVLSDTVYFYERKNHKLSL